MECVVDHKTDEHALYLPDVDSKHVSNKKVRKTNKGWHLCVELRDGITRWDPLTDLKESNPVEVSNYSVSKNLHDAPAFSLWVPYVLKKQIRIIADVTNINHNRTHKFGIEVTKSWDDCVRLEKENGNTLWQDALKKDMKNV
jgi:hypothetical protein